MEYIYETHLHTSQSSACGMTRGREYVRFYQDMGYAGIIVTDHFFRGNTAVPRNQSWRERVHLFCRGYEDAKEAGDKVGFPVFFGWEEHFQGDEYLVYGLNKAWLLEHPEAEGWTRRQQFQAVHAAGGCVVQAHPFRDKDYIPAIHLSTGCVDAVEGCNAGNRPENDVLAVRYAKVLGLPVTAGSDMHYANGSYAGLMMGVAFDQPLATIHDYVQAILEKRPLGLYVPAGRGQWMEGADILLPVDIRDANDQSTGGDVWDLLSRQ
jgi:hypothetical protein